MNASELGRAASLVSQSNDVQRVLDALNAGDGIVEMKIGPDAIPIQTEDLAYPPAMVDAIKQALTQRKAALDKELSGMGVTGI